MWIRDMLIGMLIGALLMFAIGYHFNLASRVGRVEGKVERMAEDVDRLALQGGPLKQKGR